MINATEFIQLNLNNIVIQFPTIQCKYEFDRELRTHIIEVIPEGIFTLNEEYADAESCIISDFIDSYSDENICFVTTSSLVKVKTPTFITIGRKYSDAYPYTTNWSYNHLSDKLKGIEAVVVKSENSVDTVGNQYSIAA